VTMRLTLLVALLPSSLPMSMAAPALSRCATSLRTCSDYITAAGAHSESVALATAGDALGKAGRECDVASFQLGALDWGETAISFAAAAQALAAAAASLESPLADEIELASAALKEGSSVSGCISLAAAAGPELAEAGEALCRAGGLLDSNLIVNCGEAAAQQLSLASGALTAAGSQMRLQGELLEAGRPLDEEQAS
jgi:hypothetical protein